MKYNNLLAAKLFKEALEQAKREVFLGAYAHANNNQSLAAQLLGVSRGTFIKQIRKYHDV